VRSFGRGREKRRRSGVQGQLRGSVRSDLGDDGVQLASRRIADGAFLGLA
jgi:hypothetical protein